MNKPQPILTEAEYQAALKELDRYYDCEPEPGTPEAARFEAMQSQVEAFETDRFHAKTPAQQQPPRRR
jgi:HTH-type transcriptional regulator / antitoxin HigA